MITRRCTQRQFLLRPDPATNNAFVYCLAVAAQRAGIFCVPSQGGRARTVGDPRLPKAEYARRAALRASATSAHVGSSPFEPPKHNDTTFVVDQGGGLDTGCSYRSEGPLVFEIPIDRVVGDRDKLKQNGMISDTAILEMPAYDVDSPDFCVPLPG
jgi:triacylglycerol lipase